MIFLNFIILLRVSWQTTNPQGSQPEEDLFIKSKCCCLSCPVFDSLDL